jgi:LacI family transcriptional regulator
MSVSRPSDGSPENKLRKVVVCVGSSNRYMDQIVAGIARFTGDHRRWQFYLDYLGDVTDESLANGFQCDGVIAWTPRRPTLIDALQKIKVPVVDLSREVADLTFPRVVPDDVAVGRSVAAHFIARGYKNFAFCGNPGKYWSDERETGYRLALSEAGHSCISYTDPNAGTDRYNAWEQQDIGRWVRSLPKPLALMASTDRRGRHVLINCRHFGR